MDIFTSLPDSLEVLGTFVTQVQMLASMAFAHPIWAVGLLLLGIGVLQLAADLVKRGIKAGIVFLLSLPLRTSRWIWQRATVGAPAEPNRVSTLLDRLDGLRAEEAEVLAELRGLVGTAHADSEPTIDIALGEPTVDLTSKEKTNKQGVVES